MYGNVGEWCLDYLAYPGGIAVDPQGPAGYSNPRTVRGLNNAWSANRFILYADGAAGYSRDIGFRVLLAPGQP